MSDNITVNFVVNGEETRAQVRADMNLMHFLRDYLGYTGVKNGCTSGHCGSCTIILDGEATRACLVKMKMPRLNGAQIETIEALSTDGSLHPLQHAFIEEGAVQCFHLEAKERVCIRRLLFGLKRIVADPQILAGILHFEDFACSAVDRRPVLMLTGQFFVLGWRSRCTPTVQNGRLKGILHHFDRVK